MSDPDRRDYISINQDDQNNDSNEPLLKIENPNFEQTFKNEGEKSLSDVLIPATIPPSTTNPAAIIQGIMNEVNRNGKIQMASQFEKEKFFFCNSSKELIILGNIGILQNSNTGQLNIVPPGRWSALNPFVKWKGIFSVTQELIRIENLTIVNIENGFFGLCTNNSFPFIMEAGRHVKLSRVFIYESQLPVNQAIISHKTIQVMNVPKGKVARIFIDQIPRLLELGIHVFVSSRFRYIDVIDSTQDLIKHGTITRFRVNLGKVILAWEDQNPMFFSKPGIFSRDSPNFLFVNAIDAKTKYYHLGARKNITVYNGEVGISFKEGKLVILEPGFHQISDPLHIFDGFMITRQRTLDLTRRTKGQYLECETKDLVKVGLKATLFYKVADPRKTIVEIGEQKDIEPFLLDTAIACLNSIIRSTTLTEVARSIESPEQYKKGMETHGGKASAPMFFDRAHDEFLFKLHDDFLKRYGLNIVDLRIESFKIIEEELASQISRQAIVTAKTQTELANLEGKREVATSNLNREAEVQAIKNKIYSDQILMETKAKTQASLTEAEVEGKKILAIAKARAEAKKIQAEADFEYISVMSKLPLGRETVLLKLKTEMVKEALKGTQKIVFLDSKNPLSFFQQMVDNIGKIGGLGNIPTAEDK